MGSTGGAAVTYRSTFTVTPAEEPFHEETQTLDLSDHSGRLILTAPVRPRQKLLLTNKLTQKEAECHVVRVAPSQR
jgi:hypothetical protein